MSEPEHTPPPSPPPIPDYHTGTDPLAATTLTSDPLTGNLATPLIRLAAAVIDGITLIPVYFILSKIFLSPPDPEEIQAALLKGDYSVLADGSKPPGLLAMLLVGLLVVAAFVGINWKFLPNGQTIGKKLLGLQIQSRDGSLLPVEKLLKYRLLPVYAGSAVPYLGPLAALVDALCIFRPNRNTLHDDLANSKVVQLPGAPF